MLTLVMPYYDNPSILSMHYKCWHDWPELVREQFKAIIVDDGSPESPAIEVPCPANIIGIQIYRVKEDKPWHQHGARNLGAHVADDGWLLLTDMDHMLTAEAAEALLRRLPKMDEGTVYTLARVEADTGEPTLGRDGKPKPHPNSFVLTRRMFWKIGGYDEEYEGYGTDGKFKQRAFHVGKRGHLKHVPLKRYWRGLVHDASTRTLGRKESEHRCDTKAIDKRKWDEGREHDIRVLDFEWERAL